MPLGPGRRLALGELVEDGSGQWAPTSAMRLQDHGGKLEASLGARALRVLEAALEVLVSREDGPTFVCCPRQEVGPQPRRAGKV